MAADRATANIDGILLGMARGVAPVVLVQEHGKASWNAAVLAGAAERGLVDDSRLAVALAWKDTADSVLAQALILRGCQAVADGEDQHRVAAQWLESLRKQGRTFETDWAEDAWLHIGKSASQRAREDIPGIDQSWAQVDMADHMLAYIEPWVGPAPRLREWACSAACALPNTLRSFRRGRLRWEAARIREAREVVENVTKNL